MKKILAILMAAVFCACSMFGCAQKKQVTIEKAEDLNGLKVGVQGGTTGESWVQENCPDAEVASFKSGMDAALDLKNGGIDAVVIDELPASQIVAQNSDLKILDIRFGYGIRCSPLIEAKGTKSKRVGRCRQPVARFSRPSGKSSDLPFFSGKQAYTPVIFTERCLF